MANRYEKKAWPDTFEDVKSGKRGFDLRLDDFPVTIGDTLVLREWDPKKNAYTGRTLEKKVTYIMRTKQLNYWPASEAEKKGYVVMSLG